MGPIGCPETSVNTYQSALCDNPEERRSHLHRGGSDISHTLPLLPCAIPWLRDEIHFEQFQNLLLHRTARNVPIFFISIPFFQELALPLKSLYVFQLQNYYTDRSYSNVVYCHTLYDCGQKQAYVFSVSHMQINISYKIVDYLFYAPNFSTKDHLFLKDVKFY